MSIIETKEGHIRLSNDRYAAVILPELGGKVKSLKSIQSGREFLYQDPQTHRSAKGYEAFDHSGWDECFPNIRPCADPLQPEILLPDHGWIWQTQCTWENTGNSVVVTADFDARPVRLQREFSLNPHNEFTNRYRLTNQGETPFVYLTDAHMVFEWPEALTVHLPNEVKHLYVYRSSSDAKVTPGTWETPGFWEDERTDYNTKVFSPRLQTGSIRLNYGGREGLDIRFDPESLPYVGLWISKHCNNARGESVHCFSVQPTNLASATLPPKEWLGGCPVIFPGETKEWSVTLALS